MRSDAQYIEATNSLARYLEAFYDRNIDVFFKVDSPSVSAAEVLKKAQEVRLRSAVLPEGLRSKVDNLLARSGSVARNIHQFTVTQPGDLPKEFRELQSQGQEILQEMIALELQMAGDVEMRVPA